MQDSGQQKPDGSNVNRGILSERDVERIARAITKGIKQSKEQPSGRKPTVYTVLGVVILLFVVAVAFGVWAFKDRPAQSANFRGDLGTNTTLTVAAGQGTLEQQFRETTVIALHLAGHDQPLDLYLPLAKDQQAALAAALGLEYQPGAPMAKDGPDLKLSFSQPTKINIDVKNAGYTSLNRSALDDSNAYVQIGIRASSAETIPAVAVWVLPGPIAGTVQVEAAGKPIGEFTLQPGLIDPNATMALKLSTQPRGMELGEDLGLFFGAKEPEFQTLIKNIPQSGGSAVPPIAQSVEIKNAPGGILALGPSTKTMAAAETWRLSLSRPQEIKVLANKISFSTSQDECVTSLVNEANLELLPLRFSLWPAWAQEAWRWGAITLTAGNLMTLLRFFKIFPS